VPALNVDALVVVPAVGGCHSDFSVSL
jgi:hypothetical protein